MKTMKNTLYTGDNLYILNGMNSDSVDLIYLDPPFNSKRTYSAPVGSKAAGASFKDMWSWNDVDESYLEMMVTDYPYLVQYIQAIGVIHGEGMMAYLTYMTQRIIEMHRVLKSTGSIYLHCDPTASHYLKIVLDRIFGKDNFRNEIIWHYSKWTNTAEFFQRNHDVIFFYSKSKPYTFNKQYGDPTVNQLRIRKAGYNTGSSNGVKIIRVYDKDHPNVLKKLASGAWDDYTVYYVKAPAAAPIQDIWSLSILGGQSKERTGYPTQKPLKLMNRIIQASSNEGDVILDPFCGCATTCVAAQTLNRKWIGIDIEEQAAAVLVNRLSDAAGLFEDFIHLTTTPHRTDLTIDNPKDKPIRERLYDEQKKSCNGCFTEYQLKDMETDHIIPRSKGGQDYYGNFQLLCGHCNRVKGDRPMEYLMSKIKAREQHMKAAVTFGKAKN